MTKTFQIESGASLTKGQVKQLTELLERVVYYPDVTLDQDFTKLESIIPPLFFPNLYLKVYRGGSHIAILDFNDNRVAMIRYEDVAEGETFTVQAFDSYLGSIGIEDNYVQNAVAAKYGHRLDTMQEIVNVTRAWRNPAKAKELIMRGVSV